ncbi:MAG: DUF91 domain-containing protein [Acidobacteria bacterium]|nr:DUF91 domain-containing protein [Acidobacteriota bacterium]
MRSWIDIAVEILHRRGPMEIFALVQAALAVKRLRGPNNLLGQQIFRFAKANRNALAVKEYPSFRLKSAERPRGFPTRGRLAAAYKILLLPRQYLDLRVIVDRARSMGALRSISDCPEYWMYEALMDKRFSHLFSRRGALRLAIGRGQEVNSSPRDATRTGPSAQLPAITQNIHEANLEALIADNLDCVERGLTLVGRQHPAPPVGRIDLLCKDTKGNLVVIEIKKLGASTDSVIDQVTRYIGWVRRHMATRGQLVRGIVVVGRPDPKLAYSAGAIPNLSIKSFSVALESYSGEEIDARRFNAGDRSGR